jgi:hypothetical protein
VPDPHRLLELLGVEQSDDIGDVNGEVDLRASRTHEVPEP